MTPPSFIYSPNYTETRQRRHSRDNFKSREILSFSFGFGSRELLGGYPQISMKISSCRTHAKFLTVQNVQDALVYGNCDVDRTQIRLLVQSRHKMLGVLMESTYEAFQNAEMEN